MKYSIDSFLFVDEVENRQHCGYQQFSMASWNDHGAQQDKSSSTFPTKSGKQKVPNTSNIFPISVRCLFFIDKDRIHDLLPSLPKDKCVIEVIQLQ